MTMMKFIVRRPRDDVNERTVAEDKIEMTAAESVSYTHLTLPTKRIV